jgi:hypothetical protein
MVGCYCGGRGCGFGCEIRIDVTMLAGVIVIVLIDLLIGKGI